MLAKLKYLKEEEKALKGIEMMVTEQVTRLKQEELYLRSLLRDSGEKDNLLSLPLVHTKKEEQVDDKTVNTVPLDDLQSTSHPQPHPSGIEDTEEEEEEDSGDCQESQEEDGINKDLMALMQQMQGSDTYDDF